MLFLVNNFFFFIVLTVNVFYLEVAQSSLCVGLGTVTWGVRFISFTVSSLLGHLPPQPLQ